MREHRTYLPYFSKERNQRSGFPSQESLVCFHLFILLYGIQAQERKSVVCNQPSSSTISGLQSRGGERWHNYIFLLGALSSVNAVCVTLDKPFQAC